MSAVWGKIFLNFAEKREKASVRAKPSQAKQAKPAEFASQVKQVKQASLHKFLTAAFSVINEQTR